MVQYVLLTVSLPSPPSFELAAKPYPPSSPSSLSRPHSPRSHTANAANPKGGDGGSGGGRWQGGGEGLLLQHDEKFGSKGANAEKFGPKGANAANPSAGGRPPAGGKGKGGGAAAEGGDGFDYHMGLSTRPPWYCRTGTSGGSRRAAAEGADGFDYHMGLSTCPSGCMYGATCRAYHMPCMAASALFRGGGREELGEPGGI
ncbi:unnamed protein product [Closterium sp. Naga37s-1]|nr:unnamed protein product [Closterium sp. Naga37s-1]